MDEMEEIEISTTRLLSSLQKRRRDIGRCQATDNFRQTQTNGVIFS